MIDWPNTIGLSGVVITIIGGFVTQMAQGKLFKNSRYLLWPGLMLMVGPTFALFGMITWTGYKISVVKKSMTILSQNKYEILKSTTPNLIFVVIDQDHIITIKNSKYYRNPSLILINDTTCYQRDGATFHEYSLK